MAITQPKYSEIFASGASSGELKNWPSTDYLRGWGYLGKAEPPPMEFFNALQNVSDLKDQYLFESLNIRTNTTAYTYGDVVMSPNLPKSLVLFCSIGGASDTAEPDFTDAVEGSTYTDGTVTWTIIPRAYRIVLATDDEITSAVSEVLG
jgi:hypothetical protein